jgi:hypothetical protein
VLAALAGVVGVVGVAGQAVPSPTRGWQRATPELVVQAVATTFGVARDALSEKRREREVALARQVAMYLMREETGASLKEIGAALGGRDHSTVLHGCEKVAALLTEERAVSQRSDGVEAGGTGQLGAAGTGGRLSELVEAARRAVLDATPARALGTALGTIR